MRGQRVSSRLSAFALVFVACSPFGSSIEERPRPLDERPGPKDAGTLDPIPVGEQDGGDGGAASPCSGISPCDDFERDAPADGSYGWSVIGTSSLVKIEAGEHLSGARSLVIGPTSGGAAFLAKKIPPTARTFRVAFGMRLRSGVPTTQLASVAFGDRQFVMFQASGANLEIAEQDLRPNVTHVQPCGAIGPESFSRYLMTVDVPKQVANVTRDGVAIGSIPLTFNWVDADSIRIGFTYTQGGTDVAVHFDDVGFEAR
jgi:hypothetical protein